MKQSLCLEMGLMREYQVQPRLNGDPMFAELKQIHAMRTQYINIYTSNNLVFKEL